MWTIKIRYLWLIAVMSSITLPVHAVWQVAAWNMLQEAVTNLSIDAVQNFFKPEVKPEELNDLKKKIAELNTQLEQYKNVSQLSQGEVNKVQQILASVDNTVSKLDGNVSAVEQRVAAIGSDLAVLRDATLSADSETKNLDFKVTYQYRPAGKGEFKPLTGKTTLHSGDHYKIIFTPKQDSYVSIFQLDAANKLQRIFPMDSFGGVVVNNHNPVKAGQTYYIPAKDKSLVLDTQTGVETIYFTASQQSDIVLENQFNVLQQLEQQPDAQRVETAQTQLTQTMKTKGFAAIVDDHAPAIATWKEQGETFAVPQQKLDNMCRGCLQVLTFKHE